MVTIKTTKTPVDEDNTPEASASSPTFRPSLLSFLAYVLTFLVGLALGVTYGIHGHSRQLVVIAAMALLLAAVVYLRLKGPAYLRREVLEKTRQLEELAFYDALTGLPNRKLFMDRLIQAIKHSRRYNEAFALFFIDLDGFKRVNDTLGHQTGDKLLKETAQRLQGCLRDSDTIARLGGDEFTVLLNGVSAPDDAGLAAQKILQALALPVDLSSHAIVPTGSIGITLSPQDGADPAELMQNAGLAMYQAKEGGRNNYQFFRQEMNARASRRLALEHEMQRALENQEFVLYYQPVISLEARQVVGVEALVRWEHPERGLVPPDEFIRVAEDCGLIIPLGEQILEIACHQAKMLNPEPGEPVIFMSVNLSPRQFRHPRLAEVVGDIIAKTKLEPGVLHFEITESTLMEQVDSAIHTLNRLRSLGISIAIDDFGTGYSSLNMLKHLPVDTLKVDRSFVQQIPYDVDDMEIAAAIILMGRRLHLQVVAEGVETAEQLEFLAQNHCSMAQGYLFSRPVPGSELPRVLNAGTFEVKDLLPDV